LTAKSIFHKALKLF